MVSKNGDRCGLCLGWFVSISITICFVFGSVVMPAGIASCSDDSCSESDVSSESSSSVEEYDSASSKNDYSNSDSLDDLDSSSSIVEDDSDYSIGSNNGVSSLLNSFYGTSFYSNLLVNLGYTAPVGGGGYNPTQAVQGGIGESGFYDRIAGNTYDEGANGEMLPKGYPNMRLGTTPDPMDSDKDGVPNQDDCAPFNSHKWQLLPGYTDSDGDGFGSGDEEEVCSGDELPDGYAEIGGDNCPDTFNPDQTDTDGDGMGDVCDDCTDTDDDGYGDPGFPDNICPDDCAPSDPTKWQMLTGYIDSDGDGYGTGNPEQVCSGDNLPTGYAELGGDNCPDTYNPDQADADNDGIGDVCDHDDPPTADFSWNPDEPTVDESILFSDESSENGGAINAWSWDFGDGSTSDEQNPSHSYDEAGDYVVILSVMDVSGDSDSFSQTIEILNSDVIVGAGGPYVGQVGEPVSFSGSASEGMPPYEFLWDFGDGNSSSEQNPSYSYAMPGTYEVLLSVIDDTGKMGWDTTEAVIDPEPLAVYLPDSLMERVGAPVTFAADVSGGMPPYEYMWCFGDGNISTESNPTYVYSSVGMYTVNLTVTDDDGDQAVASTVVSVVDAVADLECTGSLSWSQVKPGETISGSFTVSNNGDSGSLLNWMIDEYPEWGSWSCTPESGISLSAGEEIVVNVSVVVPDEQNSEFNGNLTVVNLGDESDQEVISVVVSTPKSGIRTPWSVLMEWVQCWFSFFSFL